MSENEGIIGTEFDFSFVPDPTESNDESSIEFFEYENKSSEGGRLSWIRRVAAIGKVLTLAKLRWLLIRLFISSILAASFLGISIGIYLIFYWIYMPVMHYEAPVYFQLSSPGRLPHVNIDFEGQFKLKPGVSYDFLLDMTTPDIPGLSEKLGNFMVSMDILSREDQSPWFSTSRPSVLPYRSQPVRVIKNMVSIAPLLLGWTQEHNKKRIFLAESVKAPAKSALNRLRLSIDTPSVPIYEARVIITAHLKGLRYFMYHWCFTCFFICVAWMFMSQCIASLLLAIIWYHASKKKKQASARSLAQTRKFASHKILFTNGNRSRSRDRFDKLKPILSRRRRTRSVEQNGESVVPGNQHVHED